MANKKVNAKKQAYKMAQIIIKKSLDLVPIPASGGLVYVGLSFDLENIVEAEAILVAAGYSGKQANVAINNLIKELKDRSENIAAIIDQARFYNEKRAHQQML